MAASLSRSRRWTSRFFLLAGYPIASWGTLRLRPAWRSGATEPVVAFEAGTAMVVVGLLLRGKPILAAVNGTTGALVAVAWLARRRRHPR